jgi:RHS repeat-associated protein
MREVTDDNGAGAVYYLHGDHLGSVSMVTGNNTANLTKLATDSRIVGVTRYKPWGEERAFSAALAGVTPTDFRFTGQRKSSYGTISFPAREYSPVLGRFVSADTIVPRPGDPQSLNRYSYVSNSPLTRIDPDGHLDIPTEIALFILGATVGVGESNAPPGAIPAHVEKANNALTTNEASFGYGRAFGNGIGFAQGVLEVVAGSAGLGGGGALCITGVGCLGGAPLAVASTGAIVHGGAVSANSAFRLTNTLANMSGSSSGSKLYGNNYDSSGLGIVAELKDSGEFSLAVKKGVGTPSGRDMFNDAWTALGGDKATSIRGIWRDADGMRDNLDSFRKAIANGLTPEQAAFETWTGKMAREKGFTRIVSVEEISDGVDVVFGK